MLNKLPRSRWIALAVLVTLILVCSAVFLNNSEHRKLTEKAAPAPKRPPHLVGHSKCAACHPEIAEEHALSGHSATFSLTSEWDLSDKLHGRMITSKNGEEYKYTSDSQGLAVALPKRFGNRLFPLDYALGSGKHAVTFLTLLQEPDGETIAIESAHTWFHSDDQLHPTPGQSSHIASRDVEFFGKIFRQDVMRDCINCHTTSAVVGVGKINNLVAGVQCERCHGPGSNHVTAAEAGDIESAVKFIKRHSTADEEIAACGQCHRMPDTIEPERLARYPDSLVRFQPVGLLMSRCYTESPGTLKCSTCHDPHADPTKTSLDDHTRRCVSCHQGTTATHCPQSPADDCIRCHMPQIPLVRDIAFHDHWIRIRKPAQRTPESKKNTEHSARKEEFHTPSTPHADN